MSGDARGIIIDISHGIRSATISVTSLRMKSGNGLGTMSCRMTGKAEELVHGNGSGIVTSQEKHRLLNSSFLSHFPLLSVYNLLV